MESMNKKKKERERKLPQENSRIVFQYTTTLCLAVIEVRYRVFLGMFSRMQNFVALV